MARTFPWLSSVPQSFIVSVATCVDTTGQGARLSAEGEAQNGNSGLLVRSARVVLTLLPTIWHLTAFLLQEETPHTLWCNSS